MAMAQRPAAVSACLGRPWHSRCQTVVRLLVLAVLTLTERSDGFAVFGYAPDYRFSSLDWDGVVQHTTHIILFSVAPTAKGDLDGIDRFWLLKQSSSPLSVALSRAGSRAPKVLISIGGPTRSDHFGAVVADKKLRRRLAQRIVELFADFPTLAGIDLNWETPKTVEEWRSYGKLAHDIRERMAPLPGKPLLTMAYHPVTGAVNHFAGLKSKSSKTSFIEYFDFCHAMSYSLFDENRRHATQRGSKLAIEEWEKFGLPSSRLTLGVPLFGISRTTSATRTWSELLDHDSSLKERTDVDETSDGMYFNNAKTLAKKVRFAKRRNLGGMMIWEVGQDKSPSNPYVGSLLRQIWAAAFADSESASLNGSRSFWSDFLAWSPFSEDNFICGTAGMIGAYLMLKSLWYNTPVRDRAPRGENDPPAEPSEEHLRIVKEAEDSWEQQEADATAAREKATAAREKAEAGVEAARAKLAAAKEKTGKVVAESGCSDEDEGAGSEAETAGAETAS